MPNFLKPGGHHWRCPFSNLTALFFLCHASLAMASVTNKEAAQAAVQRGSFAEAAVLWQQAANSYQSQKNTNGQIVALVNLAATYQALGQHPVAVQTLSEAVDLANQGGDRFSAILAKSKLGAAWTM